MYYRERVGVAVQRMKGSIIPVLVCMMFLFSPFLSVLAGTQEAPTTTRRDVSARADTQVVFFNATNSSGLGYGSRSRVAWGDYNNDGFDDILFDGWSLWRNNGDGTFSVMDYVVNLYRPGSRGGVWGDYDNDGYLDLYQMHGAEGDDVLFHNNWDGTFSDVTSQAGQISDKNLPSEGAAWGDYDRDGHLDLYVANYEWPPDSGNGTQDILYHNNGDGTFSNVTAKAGIGPEVECGRGVSWADYDDDLWPDIYVANYRLDPNFLWHNEGNGTFTNVAPALGLDGDGGLGYYGHSIGADWGDIDSDGDLDLFVANLAHPRYIAFSDISKIYTNNGPSDYTFQDVQLQTRGITYEETASDPAFGDYNNDGSLDLYITSVYDGRPSYLYMNDGTGRFSDVTASTETMTYNGWGAAWSDYNNDGTLDLIVGSGNASQFKLFQNTGNSNHWFRAELKGTTSNSFGIGARIELEYNTTKMIREVQAGTGTTSENHIGAHFGLGSWNGQVDVTIKWPSGILQTVRGLDVDQVRTFIEPPAMTDFVVRSVTYDGADVNGTVTEGTLVHFKVLAENRGTVNGSASFELSVSGFGIVGTYPLINDLGLFMTDTFYINWSSASMKGERTVTITIVDASPADSNPSDNKWTKSFHVNQRPISTIVSIEPPVAYQKKDNIEFKGSGFDDGYVVDALWVSSIDGELSHLMNFTLPASELAVGTHTVRLRVKDDHGAWSNNASKSLVVDPPVQNKRPLATIKSIEPSPAKLGDVVEFQGEGSDPDGRVLGYRWTSSLDGQIGTERIFSTSSLTLGEHTISLVSMDDQGAQSLPATSVLVVKPSNIEPIALIDSIEPNPAKEGEKVRFQGRGEDTDGTIRSYVWTSSIDGVFSYDYVFSKSDLSIGKHRIGLKVKDDTGAWSSEAFEDLEVLAVNKIPIVNITSIEKRSDGSYRVKGTAEDKDGQLVGVQIMVGSGIWYDATPLSADWSLWYYDIKPGTLELASGKYIVRARAYDGKDYSPEDTRDTNIEAPPTGPAALTKLIEDTLLGKNVPCLLGVVFFFIILVIFVWGWSGTRGPPPEPISKRPLPKKGKARSRR
jgi:hypothetical protein